MKKVGKLHSYWIVALSILSTAINSLRILWHGKKLTREKSDAIIQHWAQRMLDLVAVKLVVNNPQNITLKPNHCYIIMSNHSSVYDIPIILRSFKESVRMIAKTELFRVPIWGHAMKAAEFVEIDRGNSAKAIEALELAKEKMMSGIVPWIAPEGTRSPDGKIGPFKKGGFMMALQTGATIIPVNIQNAHILLPKKSLLLTKGVTITVTIGEPVEAKAYNKEQREALIAKVRQGIAFDEQSSTESTAV